MKTLTMRMTKRTTILSRVYRQVYVYTVAEVTSTPTGQQYREAVKAIAAEMAATDGAARAMELILSIGKDTNSESGEN